MARTDNHYREGQTNEQVEYRGADFGEQEIDLRELIEVLLRKKWIIAGLMAVAVFAAGIFTMWQREPYVATVLEFDFDEIEEGEYPSGEPFSTRDIVAPSIITQVVDELDLERYDLGVQDIREMVEVEELYYAVDDDDEDPEPAYQYRVTVSEHEDIELSNQVKRQILSCIVRQYRSEYSSEFMDRTQFPRLTEETDILEQDFPFIDRNLRSYQEMFIDHVEEGELHYSSNHGMSFHDIAREVEVLMETRYRDISSTIRGNALTKDPETAITRYNNLINELEMDEERKRSEAEYARELLQDADQLRSGDLPDMFFNVVEDGDRDLLDEIYDTLYTDNFYPQLLEVSLDAADDSIDMQYEIQRLQEDIDRMESAVGDDAEAGIEQNEELVSVVESDISRLVGELNRLVTVHNDMMEEYYQEEAKEGISYAIVPFSGTEGGNLQLNVALAAVLGAMIGVFGSFFHEFWKRNERDGEDERSGNHSHAND